MVSCLFYYVQYVYNINKLYDLTKLTRPFRIYRITAVITDETDIIARIATSPKTDILNCSLTTFYIAFILHFWIIA